MPAPPPVSSPGTPSTPGTPGSTDAAFRDSLKFKDIKDLRDMLNDPSLTDQQRMAIIDELASRMSKEAHDSGSGEEDEIQKLLKKLKNGTITPAELEKLANMLGVDPKTLEKEKGKGDEGEIK